MDNKKYTKLSELVNSQFTVTDAFGYTWKKWDDTSKRMLTSERYEEGFRKVYSVKTDKGSLDLGSGQLSALLETVYVRGKADIINRSFAVKSNGKTGLDIRYYFSAVKKEDKVYTPAEDEQEISLEDIPF